jgi:pimeloyl-ACP methyl ester carboxylesterase
MVGGARSLTRGAPVASRCGRRVQAAPLSVRVHGEAPTALVLLHGLPATGDAFGAAFDTLDAQLVVPDLLGFGSSKLPADRDVSLATHLSALDEAAAALGLQTSAWSWPVTRWVGCSPGPGRRGARLRSTPSSRGALRCSTDRPTLAVP